MWNRSTFVIFITLTMLGCFLLFTPRISADTAVVNVETLNVRVGPGLNFKITGQVHENDPLTILEEKGNWLKIKSDNVEGWVAEWMVTVTESTEETDENRSQRTDEDHPKEEATVKITGDHLRVRTGPGLDNEIIDHVNNGEVYSYISAEDNWVKIQLSDDQAGWVHKDYVVINQQEQEVQHSENVTYIVNVNILNVRNSPGTDSDLADQLSYGTKVVKLEEKDEWFKVQYDQNKEGWVASWFLRKAKEDKKKTDEQKPAGEVIVNTAILNVRDQNSLKGDIIDQIHANERYPFYKEENSWYQIKLPSGKMGWVAKWLVTADRDNNSDQQFLTLMYDYTNLRKGPSTDHQIVDRGMKGDVFEIVKKHGNWYEIKQGDETAFVAGWIVSLNRRGIQQLSLNENNLKNKVIVIDAGHGGRDTGTISASGDYEKHLTIQTANELARKLEMLGAVPILTRSDDTYLSLSSRVALSHTKRADAFLSIHYNSAPEYPSVHGISTFYYHSKDRKLANALHKKIIDATQLKDRRVKYGNYHVIRENKQPSVLLELGFLSNPEEEKVVKTSDYQEKVTNGIIRGLNEYFAQ
ncbi:MAG: SH3 domain-containing protein [Bacillaceae bacterium]|nr:SH3 domain-containing protein [Bacillaceae bacterium]